ncbi:MAG: hypothetical protein INH37_11440 [Myxococcaceae bacterium]|nr:hypothetical protein [Myxococcaceae bacterium]
MPPDRRRTTTRLALLAGCLWAGLTAAHDADVVYARLEAGPGGALLEIVTLTNATLAQLAPVDADGDGVLTQTDLDARADSLRAGVWSDLPLSAGGVACARSDEAAVLDEGFVTLSARFMCPGGDLRQDFKILRVLPSNYRVVLGSQLDGERGRRFAQGVFTALEVPRPAPAGGVDANRLRRGLERGLGDTGSVEALALLLLLVLSVTSLARLLARLGLVAAGALVVFGGGAPAAVPFAASLLATVGCLFEGASPARRWAGVGAAAFVGLGLGGRPAVVRGSEALGWWLGCAVVTVAVGAAGLPVSRLLGRRPRAGYVVRLALAAVALSAGAFRFAAAP